VQHSYAPAGLTQADAEKVAKVLQERLVSLLDLTLTLKHVHWNVVGPGFIGVHEMLDEHVVTVRSMADEVAERIATLGGIPNGLPGHLTETRTWDDYALGRAVVPAHLAALDLAYDGIVRDHRGAIATVEPLDVVTADMLTSQTGKLEMYQWFVRAHLENTSGELPTTGAGSAEEAAAAAAVADPLD
jgi:starvation-inducible DNA-binding protein